MAELAGGQHPLLFSEHHSLIHNQAFLIENHVYISPRLYPCTNSVRYDFHFFGELQRKIVARIIGVEIQGLSSSSSPERLKWTHLTHLDRFCCSM